MNKSGREVTSTFLSQEQGGNNTIWTNGELLWANGEIIAKWYDGGRIWICGLPLLRNDLLRRQVDLFRECQAWYKDGMIIEEVIKTQKGT